MKSFRDYGIDVPDNFQGERKVLCPKCSASRHKSHDPCLRVNGEKHVWHCFNCGWSGTLGNERTYYSHKFECAPEKEYRKPDPSIVQSRIAEPALRYFAARGIFEKALEAAGIFTTPHWMPGAGCEVNAIAFPYYCNGELVNVKYRDGNKNMSQEKDPMPMLWNIDNVTGDRMCICEGEIDALSLIECGIPFAVSVDKGAPQPNDKDSTKKLECVRNCMDIINRMSCVIICSDKDEPGLRLERELIEMIGAEKCKIAEYPDGCKDLNDVLTAYGKEEVVKSVDLARPVPVPGLHRFSDFMADVQNIYMHGEPKGLSTGWPSLDQIFTLQMGSLNVITGVPESGKTEFVHDLMIHTIEAHNWRWGIYSPEMMPPQNLFLNFAEKLMKKPFFGNPETRMSQSELQRAMAALDHSIFPVIPDENVDCTLDGILEMFKVLIVRDKIKGCIIDPWNELEGQPAPRGMNQSDFIGLMLHKVVRFARTNHVWFGVVAHPAKQKLEEHGPREGQFPVIRLNDISGSANFANKADCGISLWRDRRDKTSNLVEVHVLKVKNKYIGKSGDFRKLRWQRETGKFYEEM